MKLIVGEPSVDGRLYGVNLAKVNARVKKAICYELSYVVMNVSAQRCHMANKDWIWVCRMVACKSTLVLASLL